MRIVSMKEGGRPLRDRIRPRPARPLGSTREVSAADDLTSDLRADPGIGLRAEDLLQLKEEIDAVEAAARAAGRRQDLLEGGEHVVEGGRAPPVEGDAH